MLPLPCTQSPRLKPETHLAYLSQLEHTVEHIGHLRMLAQQALDAHQYVDAWMWHCLIMMFGFEVRTDRQAAQEGHSHLREAIRRYEIAFKLSANQELQARESAQCLFDAMAPKLRRKIARHNYQRMIQ